MMHGQVRVKLKNPGLRLYSLISSCTNNVCVVSEITNLMLLSLFFSNCLTRSTNRLSNFCFSLGRKRIQSQLHFTELSVHCQIYIILISLFFYLQWLFGLINSKCFTSSICSRRSISSMSNRSLYGVYPFSESLYQGLK